LPISVSMSATIGDSRRSSVPALKLRPSRPTLRRFVAKTISTARSTCRRLLGSTDASSGTSTSSSFAL
jgi:hypothetical protein